MHSQWYRNGLKLWISNVKIVLVNEGESNRKLAKMFAGKNFKKLDTKTPSCADLIKKGPDAVC